ncbi:MAG: hypothetical protein ABR554_10760 [Pyrinomonadaceae bacterium]
MFDWQSIAVALIILCALAYVGRRGLSRLRSFRAGGKGGAAACATGCGGCGGETKEVTRPSTVLVQINPKPTAKSHAARR